MFKNWKTTLFGIGSIITGAVMIVKGQFNEGITSIIAGVGLVFSKDHDANV